MTSLVIFYYNHPNTIANPLLTRKVISNYFAILFRGVFKNSSSYYCKIITVQHKLGPSNVSDGGTGCCQYIINSRIVAKKLLTAA